MSVRGVGGRGGGGERVASIVQGDWWIVCWESSWLASGGRGGERGGGGERVASIVQGDWWIVCWESSWLA